MGISRAKRRDLGYLNSKIELKDLVDGNSLLSAKERDEISKKIKNNPTVPNGRLSKEDLKKYGIGHPRYGLIKDNNKIYIVYKGVKHQKELGKGGQGVVKLIQDMDTNEYHALKVMDVNKNIEEGKKVNPTMSGEERYTKIILAEFEKEQLILKSMEKFLFSYDPGPGFEEGKTKTLLLGMKLAKGENLFKQVYNHPENQSYNPFLSPLQMLMLASSVIAAVQTVHTKNIIHRDIKSENFVADTGTCEVALVDFGHGIEARRSEKGLYQERGLWGTPAYIAPELILQHIEKEKEAKKNPRKAPFVTYTEQTEIYALGLTLARMYNLLVEGSEFHGYRRYEVKFDINVILNNKQLPKDPTLRGELLKLIHDMTAVDPEKRIKHLSEVHQRLNSILEREQKIAVLKVGVVFVDDFLKASSNKQAEMISKMKESGINTICLGDISNKTDQDYQTVMRLLEKAGMKSMVSIAFSGSDQEAVIRLASDYMNEKFKVTPYLLTYARTEKEELEEAVYRKPLSWKRSSSAKNVNTKPLSEETARLKTSQSFRTKRQAKPQVLQIPLNYLNPKVRVKDSKDNLKLLSDIEVAELRDKLKSQNDGRFNKETLKRLGIKKPCYSIIKNGDNYYAIYKGVEQGRHLGRGGYGTVKLIQDLSSGQWAVIKISHRVNNPLYHLAIDVAKSEIINLKSTGRFLFSTEHISSKNNKQQEIIIGMQLEKGKELFKMVTEGDDNIDLNMYFSPLQRLMIGANILSEVKNLMKKGLLHRDIKLQNCICDPGTCAVRIIDFGFLVSGFEYKGGFKGTYNYVAPEILATHLSPNNKIATYDEKTEVFTLGIALTMLFNLEDDYKEGKYHRVRTTPDKSKLSDDGTLPRNPEDRLALFELLHQMTSNDPKARPTIESALSSLQEILEHEKKHEIKAGIIYVNEFLAADSFTRDAIINSIKKQGINLIALADTGLEDVSENNNNAKPTNIKDYYKALKILNRWGLYNVAPNIFKGTKEDVTQSVATYFQAHYQAPLAISRFGAKEHKILFIKHSKSIIEKSVHKTSQLTFWGQSARLTDSQNDAAVKPSKLEESSDSEPDEIQQPSKSGRRPANDSIWQGKQQEVTNDNAMTTSTTEVTPTKKN